MSSSDIFPWICLKRVFERVEWGGCCHWSVGPFRPGVGAFAPLARYVAIIKAAFLRLKAMAFSRNSSFTLAHPR